MSSNFLRDPKKIYLKSKVCDEYGPLPSKLTKIEKYMESELCTRFLEKPFAKSSWETISCI